MREIIFRGKRVDNGEWVEGNYILQFDHTKMEACGFITKQEQDFDKPNFIPVEIDITTLGQFTGLCDKNGKKIFKGDIVELTLQGSWKHRRYEVFYDVETAQWLIRNGEGIDDCDKFYGQQARCNIIVIGTIHDNPELLEGV